MNAGSPFLRIHLPVLAVTLLMSLAMTGCLDKIRAKFQKKSPTVEAAGETSDGPTSQDPGAQALALDLPVLHSGSFKVTGGGVTGSGTTVLHTNPSPSQTDAVWLKLQPPVSMEVANSFGLRENDLVDLCAANGTKRSESNRYLLNFRPINPSSIPSVLGGAYVFSICDLYNPNLTSKVTDLIVTQNRGDGRPGFLAIRAPMNSTQNGSALVEGSQGALIVHLPVPGSGSGPSRNRFVLVQGITQAVPPRWEAPMMLLEPQGVYGAMAIPPKNPITLVDSTGKVTRHVVEAGRFDERSAQACATLVSAAISVPDSIYVKLQSGSGPSATHTVAIYTFSSTGVATVTGKTLTNTQFLACHSAVHLRQVAHMTPENNRSVTVAPGTGTGSGSSNPSPSPTPTPQPTGSPGTGTGTGTSSSGTGTGSGSSNPSPSPTPTPQPTGSPGTGTGSGSSTPSPRPSSSPGTGTGSGSSTPSPRPSSSPGTGSGT
jgi:hypothetical protein